MTPVWEPDAAYQARVMANIARAHAENVTLLEGEFGIDSLAARVARAVMGKTCVGCGVPLDMQTAGCRNCSARHCMRRLDARRARGAARPCTGCGINTREDATTPGCKHCKQRVYHRKYYHAIREHR